LALNFGEIAVVSMFNAAQWADMRICFSGVQVEFTLIIIIYLYLFIIFFFPCQRCHLFNTQELLSIGQLKAIEKKNQFGIIPQKSGKSRECFI